MKYYTSYTLALIFFVALSSHKTMAQNLRLQIVNEQQIPIINANVRLMPSKNFGTTDTSGIVGFENIMANSQTIEISYIGYEKMTKSIKDIKSTKDPMVIILTANNSLNEVVITGTLKEVRKSESVVPVELYTARFFRHNPTPSLFEAMNSVNGVRPQLQCSVCNTGDIHINGMEGPYTMVLIDNMPIVSGLSTVYGLSGIPNSIVERIEIVKGPAAAIYGSEAMGGIINVITKSGKNAPKLLVDMNATTYQEVNTDVATSFKIGKKVSSLLSGNYFYFDKKFDINNDNFTDIALAKRRSVFNKWTIERKKNRVADVAVRYINENRYGGEMQWTPEFRGGDSLYGESIYTNRYEILANYQLPINNQKIMLNLSANKHLQDSYYGTTKYFANQNIVFTQLTWDKKIHPKHDILLGIGHRYTYYDDNTPLTADINNNNRPEEKTLSGAFIQDENTPNKKLKLLFGARYDYSNVHKHIISPRLGAKYQFNSFNNLRLNAGNGFRTVNVFSEDHAALTGGRTVVFINNLQPERSWNANVNFTHFNSFKNGFLNIDASIFYTYYNNKIVADYLTDPNKVIYDNLQGFAENYGASINTDFNWDSGLKAMLGATFLRSFLYENGNKQTQIQTPKITSNYTISYTISKYDVCIDFNGYTNSPMLLPTFPNDYRPLRSPFFNISNLQITKKCQDKGIELYGGIKNIFNFYPKEDIIMRAFDPFDRQIGVNNPNGYTFDPSYNYAPVQRARAFVGIRMQIK
jgi:outer membrane receptor for ferrienterochelin and colicins